MSLKTGEIWSFDRDYTTPVSAAASPNNEYLCCLLTDTETSASAVFLNGKQIFPYYDNAPRLKSFPRDKFQEADKKFRNWVAEHPSDSYDGGREMSYPIWSPDSHYVILLVNDEKRSKNPDDMSNAYGKPGKGHCLVFDIQAVLAGKRIEEYQKKVPFTVSNKYRLYSLDVMYPRVWSEDGKRLSVKWVEKEDQETVIQVLPF
ncbi:MAG TPA: hypothetical protein PLA90_11445 [Candidatus Sumerlaeota bacterium]|nr:hypothetical protein [Candidatus Sumerlaeota bacterium]HPS02147.1 hypothetical protein [Candidatus Sumerlaeota bacterium]